MSADSPLLTIGIVCRNDGPWLEDCWASVLHQDDERWQAVIVMEGDADSETRRAFERLRHPKLEKYAFDEYVGHYLCDNKAFELTRTPYLFLLDADDELLPHTVSTVLETFRQHPEADFVYGDLDRFGGRSDPWPFAPTYTADDLVEDRHPPIPSAYTKKLWARLGGFPPELADGLADADFFIGAYEIGATGVHCGRPIYRFRADPPDQPSPGYRHTYHTKCEIIIQRHPQFFADGSRRRRYRAMGYAVGAFECHKLGLHREARACALKAIQYGTTGFGHRVVSNWRYIAPGWLESAGEALLRKGRGLGIRV